MYVTLFLVLWQLSLYTVAETAHAHFDSVQLTNWTDVIDVFSNKQYPPNVTREWRIKIPDNIQTSDGENGNVRLRLEFIGDVPPRWRSPICNESSDTTVVYGYLPGNGMGPRLCYTGQPLVVSTISFSFIIRFESDVKSSSAEVGFKLKYTFPQHICARCTESEICDGSQCIPVTTVAPETTTLDPCTSSPCLHHGICTPENALHFKCTCASGYRGNTCEFMDDGTFCLYGSDPYLGSNLTWQETKMGSTAKAQCPEAEGTASRFCTNVDGVAHWELPDLSECVSPNFRKIVTATDRLSTEKSVTAESVINVTSDLVDAISRHDSGRRLYAGDLSVATETVGKLADIVSRTAGNKTSLKTITQGYGDAVGKIIDPSKASVWRFTPQGYVEGKVTSILDAIETLSANVAEKTTKLMLESQHTEKRRRRSILDEEEEVIIENISAVSENLAFQIHVLDRALNFSGVETVNPSIHLPEEVFTKAIQGTSDPYIHLYNARFPSLSVLLSETNAEIFATKINKTDSRAFVNSEVLSSKFLNVPEREFQTLTHPVRLSFELQNKSTPLFLMDKCTFLNVSARSDEYRWLTKGCDRSQEESNETHTVCYCTHLTNFAVLMDIYDVESTIDPFNSDILTYLSYGGGALSIIGCLIAIVVFEFFRLKNERVRIHEQLAVSIILVQLIFLAGIDRTENKYVCMTIAILLHYFLIAMFCWMLVEGAHLYLVLVKVFMSKSHMKKYIAVGWGVPLVVVGISAGIFHEQYGQPNMCWISLKVMLVAFVPAVCLVIVINTVVLVVVMKIMVTSMSKGSKSSVEERSSIKNGQLTYYTLFQGGPQLLLTGLKAAAVLLPLLGLTWTFGFLSITNNETLLFTYLFTFFNSMQGVFFFVFHCLLSVDVQNAYDRRSRRLSQIKMNESSLSKRSRRESDNESSSFSYSKNSIKTNSTDASSCQDTNIGHRISNYTPRPHTVTFDEDVFSNPLTSYPDRLSNHTARTSFQERILSSSPIRDDVTTANHDRIHGYLEGHVLNNALQRQGSRHGSDNSENYILYYGKDNNRNSATFDEIYASVKK